MTKHFRSPIVSVLGHVDHGKSSILDTVRGTNITSREAGSITQAIGASKIPLGTIRERCGGSFGKLEGKVKIPGLLFIDTPGHAAFTSLRRRGGSLADLAIVVVDINEGLKPQTVEAITILRQSKTPFLIAANKLDLVPGYKDVGSGSIQSIKKQTKKIQQRIETKMYEIVGQVHEEFGLVAERYDRIEDYQKSVAIIPCSAVEEIGIAEMLYVLVGLSQKFLADSIEVKPEDAGKGVILEVKEEKGLGTTLDVILYDGVLKKTDTLAIGSLGEPIQGRIRALYMSGTLQDSRDVKSKYTEVEEVVAATGVKIVCPDVTDMVVSGMPVEVIREGKFEEVINRVKKRSEDADIKLDEEGVILRADTIGSLEALGKILEAREVPVRKATIGDITKKVIMDAQSNLETSPEYAAVLGFNVKKNAGHEDVAVFTSDVIYELVDHVEEWIELQEKRLDEERLSKLTTPAKFRVLKNCIFRESNPCVAGIEVLEGTVNTNTYIIDSEGNRMGTVKSLQDQNENISKASKGQQVAASFPSCTAGKNLREGMILYTDLVEDEFREYKELKDVLKENKKKIIKEIALIKRKREPLWGV